MFAFEVGLEKRSPLRSFCSSPKSSSSPGFLPCARALGRLAGVSGLPGGQVAEEELRKGALDEGNRWLEPGCRLSGEKRTDPEGRCRGGETGSLLLS